MNVQDQLALEFSDLPDGYTAAGELCPACQGGTTKERTLSVTRREGRLYWKCHRASCDFVGSDTVGWASTQRTKPLQCRGTVGRTIARHAEGVPESSREYLRQKYCLTDAHIGRFQIGWDTETNRLVLPVQDAQGNLLGVNLRSLSGARPKSKLHAESGALSWHINRATPGLIIVEDQFSAIRASDYLSSVALLGTQLNEDDAYSIKKHARGPVYLALDADAWSHAVKLVMQHRSILPMQLVKLPRDLKDMDDEELASFLAANVST